MSLLRQKYELLLAPPLPPAPAPPPPGTAAATPATPAPLTPAALEVQRRQRLNVVRRLILLDGLPPPLVEEEQSSNNLHCTLRGRLWKVLLNVHHVSLTEYTTLVRLGPSPVHGKISDDTFRTFASNKAFAARVSEDQLVRILNAFAHQNAHVQSPYIFSYVQGMNVLLAPVLFVMPELDAYFAFSRLIKDVVPMYVQPSLDGVHYGLRLMDEILRIVDPELHNHLMNCKLPASLYAMPSILTLCGCTPPLEEVLKLWDFFFAFGVHLCVVCTVAQLILIRDEIIRTLSPMKLLRTLPDLQAKPIITLCIRLVRMLPDELYDRLVRHLFDKRLYVGSQ